MEAIIRGKYLLTDPSMKKEGIIENGAVYISGGKIVETGTFEEIRRARPDAPVIGDGKALIMPGLIDAHSHGRGLSPAQKGVTGDFLENNLLDWAFMPVFPPEITSALCALRHIRSGCTTIHNNGFDIEGPGAQSYAERTIEAYLATGIRLAYSPGVRDGDRLALDAHAFFDTLPTDLQTYFRPEVEHDAKQIEENYFGLFEDLYAKYDGADTRVFPSPSWAQGCTESFLLRARETSERHGGLPIHMHCLQTPVQKAFSLRKYGKTAVKYLDDLGMLGCETVLGHAIWLTEEDIDLLAERGSSITTHPSCNLIMRNGLAPVCELLCKGVNVALGMDDKTINDDEDAILEVRMLHKLHRVASFDLTDRPLDAFDVLCCATRNAAKTLGFAGELGALTQGMRADIVLVDLDRILNDPCCSDALDIAELLVHRGMGSDVRTVIVAGEMVMQDRKILHIDVDALYQEARDILAAGLSPERRRHAEMLARLKPYYQAWYNAWLDPAGRPRYTLHSVR